FELYAFVERVYTALEFSGKIRQTKHEHANGAVAKGNEIFYKFKIRGLIFEEINTLAREGVIMMVNKKMIHGPEYSGEVLRYIYDIEHFMITTYGQQFLDDYQALAYDIEEYIMSLAKIEQPSDELKMYLSEGLQCLRHHLARSAIILLRLACEDILHELADAIEAKNKTLSITSSFSAKDVKRSTLDEKIQKVMTPLTSNVKLLPRGTLKNELPLVTEAFHNIRRKANDAAHTSTVMELNRVRFHYVSFAEIIYPNIKQIIQQF
ncbi:hypothetical protein HC776_03355, partial [bacterium]|nr:hypothetical protein [bacterium]